MNEAGLVRFCEPLRDLNPDVQHLAGRERAVREQLAQRPSFDELHREVDRRVDRADVVNRDDVGMIQRRRAAGFLLEPGPAHLVSGDLGEQHLDGDLAPEARVPRPVDLAHAAGAERRNDLVGPETGTRSQRHLRERLSRDD